MTAGEVLPLAEQVFADKAVAAVGREKVAGAFTERVRPSLPLVGLAAASLAVTGLSASPATPAVVFALFALLLGGLSLVTSSVCLARKDSVYNSSSMASAVDYGAAYGDSGMFPAAKKGSVYDNSGMPLPADKGSYYMMFAHEPDVTAGEALPFTEQVFADKAIAAVGRDKVGGAFTERVRRFLPVVGTATASLAVTGLAAGTATPAVGFALLTLLLVGLSLVTIGVSQLS